jgi:VWFA-related protein
VFVIFSWGEKIMQAVRLDTITQYPWRSYSVRILRVYALLLLVQSPVSFAASANESSSGPFRASVSEVRLTFFTTDDNNRPINTIQSDDFVVVDGETVIREYRSFARSDETAVDLLVMVDASDSVASRFQATMKDMQQLISLKQVATEENVSVASFGGLEPVMLCTGDCLSSEAGKKLLSVKAAGTTPLFDAVSLGATFLSRRRTSAARPILILFSDGDDTVSKTSAQDALQSVIACGALLYVIDLNNPGDASQGSAMLRQMAEATGGRYFSSPQGAPNVLQAALQDLRASYVVTYQLPSLEVGFHSLRILPKHNLKLRFHNRSGYYYGTSIP